MKVIWLSPKKLFPVNSGAKKATWALLKPLMAQYQDFHIEKLLLYQVDVEDQIQSEIDPLFDQKNFILHHFKIHKISNSMMSYVKVKFFDLFRPFTILKYRSEPLKVKVSQDLIGLLRTNEMQSHSKIFFIIDGLHAYELIDFDEIKSLNLHKNIHLVYRSHNVESSLWKQTFKNEKNFLKKMIFYFEYYLMNKYEQQVLRNVDQVFTVSEVDRLQYLGENKSESWDNKIFSLPIGTSFSKLDFSQGLGLDSSQKMNLLFVGKLDWLPNAEGLTWFVTHVWPYVKSKFNLTVVGSGQNFELIKMLNSSEIQCYRNVSSLMEFYQKADLTIIPIFTGSGTRVKAIEAAGMGRTFITTSIGIEGVNCQPHEDYFLAESSQEWRDILLNLNLNEVRLMSNSLYQRLESEYSNITIAHKFVKSITQND